jgi:hypothetical protein
MKETTQNINAESLVEMLLKNLDNVRFGNVSLTLHKHDGRVVSVTTTVAQQTREQLGGEIVREP